MTGLAGPGRAGGVRRKCAKQTAKKGRCKVRVIDGHYHTRHESCYITRCGDTQGGQAVANTGLSLRPQTGGEFPFSIVPLRIVS